MPVLVHLREPINSVVFKKTCLRIRVELTYLKILIVRGGMGNLGVIKSSSGQHKPACMYVCDEN